MRLLNLAFLALVLCFPLRRVEAAYSYGITPAGASVADAGIAAKYADYKTRYFVDCSGTQTRVANNEGSSETFSEGQAYGMLFVAYLEPDATGPALMQKLLNFLNSKLDSSGLMHWRVTCGGVTGSNAASDAEVDYALALIKAHQRWPGNGFDTAAINFIDRILQYETDACGLKPGDAWGGCGSEASPSYASLNYFPCFGQFTGDVAQWATVRTNTYNRQLAYWLANYALPPDWVALDLTANSGRHSRQNYQYDAARTPYRVGMDYLWYGNADSKAQVDKITNNFKATDPNPATMGDGYNYSTGAKYSNNHNAVFTGTAAVGAMASAANQTWLNQAYNDVKNMAQQNYYLDSWRLLSLMTMTGVFTNPCGGPVGTNTVSPTITRTHTRSPTATPTQTPAPAFGLAKSAASASAAVGSTISYYIDYSNLSTGPDTSGVTPGMELRYANGSQSGTLTRVNANFQIYNGTGATVNLADYRIRYFAYGTAPMDVAGSYTHWEYYDQSTTGSSSTLTYPLWDGGAKKANMELRVVFSGGTLGNGSTSNYEGAWGSDSNNSNTADDYSHPGPVGSYTPATVAVLEQNVGGTWKLADGAYPGGGSAIANVTVSDVLDSRLDYLGSVPAGTWSAGPRTFSYTIASLAPGGYGRITLTALVNGTAVAGNVVPNSASIAATGFPSATSNTYNVTITGANTPTFTATRTSSPTATRTASPTASRTASSSPTQTVTGTPTASHTPLAPSATHTPTATPSRTASRTSSPSGTPTATSSATPLAPSATHTPTSTPSRTASRTGTPSSTSTASPSATPLAPSATHTPTTTPSRTATPSGTRSATGSSTPTATGSASPSATRTASPTATASRTASQSPTSTPSATPSATRTATRTVTGTATPSRTPTNSPSATPSHTEVPPGSTDTVTPTRTESFTASPTATPTETRTQTPVDTATYTPVDTATYTPVDTATYTPVDTATYTPVDTATYTPVNTATFTSVITATYTPVNTATFTPVNTATFTPVNTATFTPVNTATYTPVNTATFSPVNTATFTATRTATPTPTRSSTALGSPTFTPTRTPSTVIPATLTPTPQDTATSVPGVADGPLDIDAHKAWPNPVRGGSPAFVSVHLTGSADSLKLKLYTRAWACVGEAASGPQAAGWARLTIPRSTLDALPNGAYYYVVEAERAGKKALRPAKGSLMLLR